MKRRTSWIGLRARLKVLERETGATGGWSDRALRISENKYRYLIENIKEVLYSFDLDGKNHLCQPLCKDIHRL